jgi:hypothetical protein
MRSVFEEGHSLEEFDHHVLAQIEQVDAHLPNWGTRQQGV